MAECENQVQGLPFVGVNNHHKHHISEQMIRSISDLSRATMIHAKKIWSSTTSANLWPYALKVERYAFEQKSKSIGQNAQNTKPEFFRVLNSAYCLIQYSKKSSRTILTLDRL